MEDYYQKNFAEYHRKTFFVNPSSFLKPFVKLIPKGASVLDVGCGSGRDVLWLKKRGFIVSGFEKSPGLVNLARKHTGCEIIEGDFETYDFAKLTFDAVLLSGALVHIPPEKLSNIFKRITAVLKENGFIYISLKQGNYSMTDQSGRIFYLWQHRDLQDMFSRLNFSILDKTITKSALKSADIWLGYVLRANW